MLLETIKGVHHHLVEIVVVLGIILFLLLMISYQLNPYGEVRTIVINMKNLEWKTRSFSASFLVYTIIFGWIWQPLLALHLKRYKYIRVIFKELSRLDSINFSPKASRVIIILTMVSFVFLKIYPYLYYKSPIGIDTGEYLLILRILEKETKISLSGTNLGPSISFLLTFIPIIPLRAFGISWEVIIAFFPIPAGILYILSNYFFIKDNAGKDIGLFVVLFSAFSLTVQLLTSVTYRNAMSLSIFTLLFLSYLNYINYRKKQDLIFLTSFFIWLLIQYPWMAIMIFPIMLLFIILNSFTKSLRSLIKNMVFPLIIYLLIVLIPITINIICNIKFKVHFLNLQEFLYKNLIPLISEFKLKNIIPSTMVSLYNKPFYSYFVDSPILLIFALIGILTTLTSTNLDKKGILFRNMLFSWFIIVSLIIIIIPREGYRLVLNYPLPIYSAIGLNFLISFVSLILKYITSVKLKFKRDINF